MSRLAILSAGGDCPGINAVIRAVAKTADQRGWEVVGFRNGYRGAVENDFLMLGPEETAGLLPRGGTVLGTDNRYDPSDFPVEEDGRVVRRDLSQQVADNLQRLDVQGLIAIGGDGTMAVTRKLIEKVGLKAICVPKTIDNDLPSTDQTFGFDTAVRTATDALDKLHTTAESHHRVMVLELMGRYAGWIALYTGLSGGADVILIPEIRWDPDVVARKILERRARGRLFSVVVVAEGTLTPEGERVVQRRVPDSHEQIRLGGIGQLVGELIEEKTGIETRVTILGHIQRGGSPSPYDRMLATRLGVAAGELALEGRYGNLVALRQGTIQAVPLDQVETGIRTVRPDGPEVEAARAIGICFGDR
ncbi:6-phosphofructokinase [Limnochorda pilosa]|uniref:ATP-dependent 6-phosphofructokinase n=1 Tax=Limnochorda pilosa TaxID=1555112 RepID=A0A0K2SMM1_LIMPI|nr:ATP-dependent 6-phosphofructokinase [Limnochorda pilosa]BAS28355.1 6-phosphofructokinase [Limnochorda pilosa]